MSAYRARHKAKWADNSYSFRFTPSISRSHVASARIAEARLRKAAYDLDPSPYGSWIVVPPRKHATRTEKQRNLQSSRAVNGKVVAMG